MTFEISGQTCKDFSAAARSASTYGKVDTPVNSHPNVDNKKAERMFEAELKKRLNDVNEANEKFVRFLVAWAKNSEKAIRVQQNSP